MNIQQVKKGANITLYNGIYMILFGIVYSFLIKYNMNYNFGAVEELWGFFAKYNPKIAYLFFLFNVLIVIFLISNGIILIYLSDFIKKRKEKMTWVILFLSGIISWGGLLVISILFKNPLLIGLSFIGWFSFIAGMVIPIKYYAEKAYREY